MPSYKSVNYSIRPNKNVERKLLVESLTELSASFDFQKYRYIGMGSMWFTDFILFHRSLRIKEMISVEKNKKGKTRATFNIPFSCIDVLGGEISNYLPGLLPKDKRCLIWLDYDQSWECTVIKDIATICEKGESGTVLIITLNADSERLIGVKDPNGTDLNQIDALEFYLKEFFPPQFDEVQFEQNNYPQFVGEILFNIVDHYVLQNKRLKFISFYNFYYNDNTPMVTVGGMLVDEKDLEILNSIDLGKKFSYLSLNRNQTRILIPHLTLKEKALLDSILPERENITAAELKRDFKLALSNSEIKEYIKYYRYYPAFAEFLM